jgi:hypothetical protein
MLQINLLPDVKKEFLRAQRQRNLVMTISILASVVAGSIILIMGLVMGGQLVQKNILNGNIDRDKKTIQKEQSDNQLNEYLTVQNQLSQIDNLKETQPVFSRVFDYLKQLNPAAPNSVELSSVRILSAGSADGVSTGMIELQGSTADFASLDVYKTTLLHTKITYSDGSDGDAVTEALFSEVTVRDAGLSQGDGEDRVSFTIDVIYNEAAFKASSTAVTLKIPQETTSDADRNAPTFNSQPAKTDSTNQEANNGE